MISTDQLAKTLRDAFESYRTEREAGQFGGLTPWNELPHGRKQKWYKMAEAAVDALFEPCVCNYGPDSDGPDEYCPRHGRTYNELLGFLQELSQQNQELAKRGGPEF